MPSIVRITFVYLIASNNTAIYPIYATAVNRPFFLYLIIKNHTFIDENEPLGQQKTYLQKYLQNKGFTDFGKSFFKIYNII